MTVTKSGLSFTRILSSVKPPGYTHAGDTDEVNQLAIVRSGTMLTLCQMKSLTLLVHFVSVHQSSSRSLPGRAAPGCTVFIYNLVGLRLLAASYYLVDFCSCFYYLALLRFTTARYLLCTYARRLRAEDEDVEARKLCCLLCLQSCRSRGCKSPRYGK